MVICYTCVVVVADVGLQQRRVQRHQHNEPTKINGARQKRNFWWMKMESEKVHAIILARKFATQTNEKLPDELTASRFTSVNCAVNEDVSFYRFRTLFRSLESGFLFHTCSPSSLLRTLPSHAVSPHLNLLFFQSHLPYLSRRIPHSIPLSLPPLFIWTMSCDFYFYYLSSCIKQSSLPLFVLERLHRVAKPTYSTIEKRRFTYTLNVLKSNYVPISTIFIFTEIDNIGFSRNRIPSSSSSSSSSCSANSTGWDHVHEFME